MANKIDVRIVKTKEKLKKTLLQLLESKSVDEISISEICSTAGINRNTFYSHYQDVKGLLEEVKSSYLESFLKEIGAGNKYSESSQKFFCSVLESMRDNMEISRLLFASQGGEMFLKTVVKFSLPDDLKDLNFESSAITSNDLYQFLVGGTVSIIQDWISNDFFEEPEKIAVKISFFIQQFRTHF